MARNSGYVSSNVQERVYSGTLGYGVATGTGASSSITAGGIAYTLLTFTSDGSLTVSTAGLFDILMVGGGAAAGNAYYNNPAPTTWGCSAGGGGGGVLGYYSGFNTVDTLTLFFDTGVYTIDVGLGGTPFGDANNYYYAPGLPGRPSRIAPAGANSATYTILEALGGGGGAAAGPWSSSDYAYSIGKDGANGGGSTWTGFPFLGEGLSWDSTYGTNVPTYPAGAIPGFPRGRRGSSGSVSNGSGNSTNRGGGGAGAAGDAGNSSSGVGGSGGNGLDVSAWLGQGSPYYIGAGGAGAGNSSGGAAGLGGVAGRNNGQANNGISGVQPGAGGGGCAANSNIGNCLGGFGAPGAIWVRFRV